MEPIKVEMTDTPVTPAPEAQKPAATEPKSEPKYVKFEDLEKVNQSINNTREWNNRKISSLEQKIDQLLSQGKKPEAKEAQDDLDDLVTKNWQLGVEKVAERVVDRKLASTQAQTKEQQELQELEQSKRKVLERHPELNDPDSPKTREFLKVLDENPRWKSYTDGPLIAMREMENRIKPSGTIESGDNMRETRSKATSIPKGTSTNQRGKYSLTAQDMEFCKINGINPESYKHYRGQREVEA